MESVNISKILHDVRVILDQNAEDYGVAGVGEYTLELDDVIRKGIIPAVEWAHMNAPVTKMTGKEIAMTPSPLLPPNALQLPDDFLRLVSLKASNWNRAISTYYPEDDPYVSQILSGYAGLMPTANKPAAVMRLEGGKRYLLLYPFVDDDDSSDDSSAATEGDTITSAYYIPIPTIDDDDSSDDSSVSDPSVDIEPTCYDAFLYYLAYLTKITYNEDSKFLEQAQALL